MRDKAIKELEEQPVLDRIERLRLNGTGIKSRMLRTMHEMVVEEKPKRLIKRV